MQRFDRQFVAAIAAIAVVCTPASAAEKVAPKGPSAFVRCDGSPNKPSELGTIARLIAITAVVGLLIPSREAADPSKREKGAAGVAACDEALNGADKASDGGRRIELLLGRSIHNMELGNWDDAIADLHRIPTDQPELAATQAYKESLGRSALSLEAMAMVGKGQYHEARVMAQTMVDAAPYNYRGVVGAIDYMRLDNIWDQGKERYFNQYVRIYPAGLIDRAGALSIAGRFAGAAEDYMSLDHLNRSIPDWRGYHFKARAAIAYYFAGDLERSGAVLEQARAEAKAETNPNNTSLQSVVAEAGDFIEILKHLDKGEVALARTMFAARSEWVQLSPGLTAELARRLDAASSEEQRAAVPIKSADELLAKLTKWSIDLINDPGTDGKDRWNLIDQPISPNSFNRFAKNVWQTDKSKYLAKEPNKSWEATFLDTTRDGEGIPGAYAFYLHAALLAKARGKDGFMVMLNQKYVFAHFVRIGNAGDEDIVPAILFDPDKVIEDLAPYFPRQVQK